MQGSSISGFGLKAKILSGLSGFLILTIATNLVFSNYLLTKDKKAYIFESVLSSTEEVKKIISEGIQNSIFQAEALIQVDRSDKAEAEKLFNKQNFIDAMSYYENGNETLFLSKESYPEHPDNFIGAIEKWKNASPKEGESGLKIQKLGNFNAFAVTYSLPDRTLRLLINMNLLWNRISGDTIFNYMILGNDNGVMWKTGDDTLNNVYELLPNNNTSITKEIDNGGNKFLASAATIPDLRIKVLSYIPASKAYSVVADLGVRLLAFGLIILGLSLITGLIFSSRITTPIQTLMDGAFHIAEGDFSYQVDVQSKDELFVLGEQFNFMSGKIGDLLGEKEIIIDELKEAKAKIEDYSRNLEIKVEERTKELKAARDFIQTMVDSLDQGLFVIDREMNCLPIYTKACVNLFGKTPEGLSFTEVLDIGEDKKDEISTWVQILFDESIPFDSAVVLGVKEKVYSNPGESDFKVLKLNYYPIRNEQDAIINIVTVATDKTNEVLAIEESKKRQKYVEMIFKIIGNKRQFMDFDNELQDYLKALDELFLEEKPDLDRAMLIYHTFTGGLGMYAIDSLMNLSRSSEQSIVDMKKANSFDYERLRKEKDVFKESYENFKQELFELLGFKSHTVEVDKGVILYLNELVQETTNRELKHVYSEHFMKVPVEQYLSPYKALLASLGPKLNKEFAPLEVVNGDLRVDPEKYQEFFSLMVHLIRNCADHGIESPEKRMDLQKDPQGKIKISSEIINQGQTFRMVVEDDGGGINPERIRSKLMEKRPGVNVTEPDNEVIYHIFDPDFSTAEQVTSISGRGVGMSAIKDVVDRMHGRIILDSKVGKGTKFIFELPAS